MNQDLQDFIKQSKESGMTDEQIKQELLKVGWDESDIDKAFNPNLEQNSKNIWKIIIPIIAGIAIIGAGIWWWQRPADETETQAETPKNLASRNAERKAKIFQIYSALEEYKKDYGSYPKGTSNSITGSVIGTGIFTDDLDKNPLVPEYINEVIKDPLNKDYFRYNYYHGIKEYDINYVLYVKLENENESTNNQYFCMDSFSVESPVVVSTSYEADLTQCGEIEITQEMKEAKSSNMLFSLVKQIRLGLSMYKDDNGFYPQKLIDLYPMPIGNKEILENTDIFYAYYPAQNPSKYHIGIEMLESSNFLSTDADFNSQSAGYINGFNGADPMYDAVELE